MDDRPLLLPEAFSFVKLGRCGRLLVAQKLGITMKRKDKNRQILVEATLDCIAEIGLIETSVSQIVARAGLSRGMIHLHFGGKDQLIVEAAKFASERYYQILDKNLEGTECNPVELIVAAVKSDLSPEALNKKDVSIWYEFRGASRTCNAIAEFSDTRDRRLRNLLNSAILKICRHEGIETPDNAARDFTTGLLALTEGMWTDYLLHPDEFDRANARKIVFRFLAGVWPNSFGGYAAL